MRGARGEGSDRVLLGCFRTDAGNCEFPKVSRPLALSTAELLEAPFQGSRRRHLPAAAARPDGTRARPGGHRHFRGRGGWRCGLVRKRAGKEGTIDLRCEASSQLVGEREWTGRKPEDKGAKGTDSACGNFSLAGWDIPSGGGTLFPASSGQGAGPDLFPF